MKVGTMLTSITAIICFAILAVLFNHWWIALFALLFMHSVKETQDDSEKDEVSE